MNPRPKSTRLSEWTPILGVAPGVGNQGDWSVARLSSREFQRVSEFVEHYCGVHLPVKKKIMVEGRLRRRLKALGLDSFDQYLDQVFQSVNGGDEVVHMIDAITTNKTDFFRESRHFKFLVDKLLPEYLSRQDEGHRSPICLWSAGCSTGEEAYTLSMVLAGFGERQAGSHFDFTILATDISSQVLEIARRGIYAEERIAPVPEDLRLKYVLRSRDRTRGEVRIAPEIRSRVTFRRLNLMEREPGLRASVDVVFCRNVLIYFTRKTQEEIVNSFFNYLRPGGYLFVGHSETLTGLSTPFRLIQPTVYRAGS